jgi:AraC family transcriptional regulator
MREATFQDYQERILRVLLHIQRHLDEPLDLDRLAGVAAFSPYHFHRIFRGMVGETVHGHVRRLRLERAASRLRHTDDPVTRIALEAGYESHEAFTRAFRDAFGEPPSAFRNQVGGHDGKMPSPAGIHLATDGRTPGFRPVRDEGAAMDVKICERDPLRVAFIRHVGPYDQCGKAWERLCEWAGPNGLMGPGAEMLGVCHDDPDVTPPGRIRYDACITVDAGIEPEGDVGVQTLAGGPYARFTHHGAYDRLGETYAALMGQWLPRSGRRLRSEPCIEAYLNDPDGTDPEDLVTDIYVPLEP